jgi:hypothetical protein
MEPLLELNDKRFTGEEKEAEGLKNGVDKGGVAVGYPNLNPTPVSVGNMVDLGPSDPNTSASYTCSC